MTNPERRGSEGPNLYEVLGVRVDAPADEIRLAFHRFALQHHPDRHPDACGEARVRLEAWYRRGTEAYRTLSDPVARRAYDTRLGVRNEGAAEVGGRRASGRPRFRSPRARPFVRKAQRAMAEGDWASAALNLRLALRHEPGHPWLEVQLAEAERRLG